MYQLRLREQLQEPPAGHMQMTWQMHGTVPHDPFLQSCTCLFGKNATKKRKKKTTTYGQSPHYFFPINTTSHDT